MLKKTITLTDAQFKTLSTPIVIVPATQDYANYTIVPTKIPILFGGYISVDQSAGAYTSAATTPFLIITLGSDYSTDLSAPIEAIFVGATAEKYIFSILPRGNEPTATLVSGRKFAYGAPIISAGAGLFDNAIAISVNAVAGAANFGGGNAANTTEITLYYDYVDV